MSRKKEAALQEFFVSNDDFNAGISQNGSLYVVDAYPRWTGACKSICSTLKRIKLEMSSPRLKFATGCIDEIDVLAEYRDLPPEPLFLFYASGVLVDLCQGCNVPLLTRKIELQINNENAIEEGSQERKAYAVERPTTAVSHTTLDETNPSLTNVGSAESKKLSFAFVTPVYVEHASAIKEKFAEAGIEVLAERQHMITREELVHIFPDILDEDKFISGDAFIDYITTGTSVLFVVTREGEHGIGIIDQMLALIGPSDQDTAKIESPDSVNALFGNTCMFGSNDSHMAHRAINLLFEGFGAPTISARASAVNAASSSNNMVYAVYGDCSNELQIQLQNYGCQVIEEATETDPEHFERWAVPEEFRELAKRVLVISCAKSHNSITSFFDSTGEQHYIQGRNSSRPSSAMPDSMPGSGDEGGLPDASSGDDEALPGEES